MDRLTESPIPHTVGFGRVKRFEDLSRVLRRETDPCIFHAQTDLVAFTSLRPDEHLSWATVDGAHRVCCISKQVKMTC
jgi:hypothetical protein